MPAAPALPPPVSNFAHSWSAPFGRSMGERTLTMYPPSRATSTACADAGRASEGGR